MKKVQSREEFKSNIEGMYHIEVEKSICPVKVILTVKAVLGMISVHSTLISVRRTAKIQLNGRPHGTDRPIV
jgi:hypothetical protein